MAVTIEQIKETLSSSTVEVQTIVNYLVSIGNESIDPSKGWVAGGFSVMTTMGVREIPQHQVWPPKEGMVPFHKKNEQGEWVPDLRVVEIGKFINSHGGFDMMQGFYYEVKNNYNGQIRYLEKAWDGIGRWESRY